MRSLSLVVRFCSGGWKMKNVRLNIRISARRIRALRTILHAFKGISLT
jgi:hypothetical protein